MDTKKAPPKKSSGALSFPNPGVICDPAGQACYDRQGISLGITRATYGSKAEEQLVKNLKGRPAPREFWIGIGAVCSLPKQTCWQDGWSRSKVPQRLTRQLFGNPGPVSSKEGSCNLSKANRSSYKGPCDLRSETPQGSSRYVLSLDDGRRFNFVNRNGRYEMSDSGGSWPVHVENRSSSAIFHWADYSLLASRSNGFGSGSSSSSGNGLAMRASLGTLMQALFLPTAGSGAIPPPADFGSGSSSGYNSSMGMASPAATIVFPYDGSCVTYSDQADSFRLNLNRGQWLQVQAVDRGITLLAPSGSSLPSAYGTGEWNLPESGTYAVNVEYPAAEGMGVRFCLR